MMKHKPILILAIALIIAQILTTGLVAAQIKIESKPTIMPTVTPLPVVPVDKRPTDKAVLTELDRLDIDVKYVEKTGTTVYSERYTDTKSGTTIEAFSQLPLKTIDDKLIEVGFTQAGNTFISNHNIYRVVVSGPRVTLTALYEQPSSPVGGTMAWNPSLHVGSKTYTADNPVLLATDPYNSYYHNNVIEWDYDVAKRQLRIIEGMVLERWIFSADPQGDVVIQHNQTGDFRLDIGEAWDSDGNILKASKFMDDYEIVGRAEFIDKTYPVTLAGTSTFYPDAHVESSSVDGYAYHTVAAGTTWNAIHDGVGTGASSSANAMISGVFSYSVDPDEWRTTERAICLFDTSSLPDNCAIDTATISLRGAIKANFYGTTPYYNIYSSAPASNTNIVSGDYDSLGTTEYSTDLLHTSVSVAAYNDFVLNSSGRDAISKTDITKLGVRVSWDADDSPPTWVDGSAYVQWWTADKGTDYKPKLVVVYTEPPTVVTLATSSITDTTATLNGNITDIGGGNVTTIAFDWGLTDAYGSTWSDTVNYGVPTSFSHDITGLDPNTTYHFRAKVYNSVGWGYSTDSTFTTSVGTPSITTNAATNIATTSARLNSYITDDGGESCSVRFNYYKSGGAFGDNTTAWQAGKITGNNPYADITGLDASSTYYFRAEIDNSDSTQYGSTLSFETESTVSGPSGCLAIPQKYDPAIDLSWTRGDGSSETIVRFKIGSYPTSTSDGTFLVQTDKGSYEHSDLDPGTSYYYLLVGISGNTTSTGNCTIMATTTSAIGTDTITDTDLPSSWFTSIDYTNMSFLPIYDIVNSASDDFGIPRNTFWMIFVLFIIMAIGLSTFAYGRVATNMQSANSLLISMAIVLVLMAAGAVAQIVPGYMAILFFVITAGIGFSRRMFA